MPMLTGTAMSTATAALRTEPKMNAAAPKNLSGGDHRDDVKKSRPIRSSADHARLVIVMAMRLSTTSTSAAAAKASHEKIRSAQPPRAFRLVLTTAIGGHLLCCTVANAAAGTEGPPPPASGGMWSGRELDLVELVDRLLLELVGQLGEVDVGGGVLAVGQDVVDERLG